MPQDELNSNIAHFTTHIKPVLQQIWLLTGLNNVGVRDGSLENLWGGEGGADEVQRKNSLKGKLNEKKNHLRQLTLENIHATA